MWSKLIQIERKEQFVQYLCLFNKLEARTIPRLERSIQFVEIFLGVCSQGKWIQTLSHSRKIVRGAKLRESRLIMNLFRAKYLLTFLGYDARYVRELDKTLDQMITTDYPETLVPELRSYIERQRDYISTFRGVEQL